MIDRWSFEWPVPEGLTVEGDALVIPEDWNFGGRYAPLARHEALFREFGQIEPSPDGVLRFARKYGPLGIWKVDRDLGVYELLSIWYLEIQLMNALVTLWQEINTRDVASLRARVKRQSAVVSGVVFDPKDPTAWDWEDNAGLGPLIYRPTEFIGLAQDTMPDGTKQDVLSPCLTMLTRRLSHLLEETCAPVLTVRKAKPRFFLRPSHLRGALWLQFANAVVGQKRFRACRNCGQWFEFSPSPDRPTSTRSDKIFCGDSCRVTFHRKRPARARDLAADGYSVAKIATELGSKPSSVERWLADKEPEKQKGGEHAK